MANHHGDFDYEQHRNKYSGQRRTDPRIAAQVTAALGAARSVLNVGAGAGSYEPEDRYVLAIEPSPTMRAQRPRHLAPAIHGVAEHLPLDDHSVDALMATVTVHQWSNLSAGLSEMRRVSRGPVVILTFDPNELERLWLAEYAPELFAVERRRYPAIKTICAALGTNTRVSSIPIPIDCLDGFTEAFYARPECFLDAAVRRAQSAWGFLEPGIEEKSMQVLADDLSCGAWDRRFGALRSQPYFDGAVRLIVSA